jgi:pimeloyl-ACP methyl ester carboxylesterase
LLDDALDAALCRDRQQVTVVGYSFGARAAAWWLGCTSAALAQDSSLPKRGLAGRGVAAALLESAHPGLSAPSAALRRQEDQARAAAVQQSGVQAFGQFWANLALFATQQGLPGAVLRAQQRIRLRQAAAGLADHLQSLGTGTMPRLDLAPAPPWPTAFLAGELDANYADLARNWQQAWPQSSLMIAPGAGHNVHLEKPLLWWKYLRALM